MRGLHSCRLFAMAVVVLAIANSTVAPAQTFSVLYNFGSKSGDPHQPSYAGIVAQGRDGNLYSTTPIGGVYGKGAAFQITQAGKLTVLHSFDGMHDGANNYCTTRVSFVECTKLAEPELKVPITVKL